MLRPDGMNLVITDRLADVHFRAYQRFPADAAPAAALEIVAQTVRAQVSAAGLAWRSMAGAAHVASTVPGGDRFGCRDRLSIVGYAATAAIERKERTDGIGLGVRSPLYG